MRTLGVEVRCIGLMQSKQLVADEVVAGREALGDGGLLEEVLEDFCRAPVAAA